MGIRKWGYGSSVEWLRSPEPMTWRRTYAGRPDQVHAARQFALVLFAGTGHDEEIAFIVSELATNAVIHTRSGNPGGWFGLEVILGDPAYIAVTDQGGTKFPTILPEPSDDTRAENGRGLFAISKLAIAMGIHGSRDGGHTIWADVDLRAHPKTRPEPPVRLVS